MSLVPVLGYLATFASGLACAHNNLEGAPRLLVVYSILYKGNG